MSLPSEPPVTAQPTRPPVRVLTISASFGAGGSYVAPRVAERLGWHFLDRMIPYQVSERLAAPLEEVLAHDDQHDAGALRRLLTAFATVEPMLGALSANAPATAREDVVGATEQLLREAADEGDVVVLGRGGALVLADRVDAVHVRLDGPRAQRLERVARGMHLPEAEARRLLERSDRAREAYVQRLYHVDARDPANYHLVLDSIRLPLDTCVASIVTAMIK